MFSLPNIEFMWAWNKSETRAFVVWLSGVLAVAQAAGWRLETSAAPVPEFSSCIDVRGASWIKHARNDAYLRASETDGTREESVSVFACLCAVWVVRGYHTEQTGMNHTKISSEELRSLPPRPSLLPAVLPKRRFARLGRKTSDGSQKWVKNKHCTNELFFPSSCWFSSRWQIFSLLVTQTSHKELHFCRGYP